MKKTAKEPSRSQASPWAHLVMPLAAVVRGDLLNLVHELGLHAFQAMLETERTRLCGERYRHDPRRRCSRGGSTAGELALGGRRVAVQRPRVVDREGREVPLSTWQHFLGADPLDKRAFEQMAVGVATRKYGRSLEPLPVSVRARGASKSAVSRRFVDLTTDKLTEWMARPLVGLDLCAVFIDGIHFGDHVVLCSLGVDTTGIKHVLGIWEGATENEVACKAMLEDLVSRGLRPNRSRLFVIDGSKGLRSSIRDVFGRKTLVQRCQVHKLRNVLGHLPNEKHAETRAAMREAYRATRIDTAKRLLNNLVATLQKKYPSAAASVREGLDETLTVMGLGLSNSLTRFLSTTNPIENLNDRIRSTARRVKRWNGGTMILRWVLVGVLEAHRGFRRVRGYKGLGALVAILAKLDTASGISTVDAKSVAA